MTHLDSNTGVPVGAVSSLEACINDHCTGTSVEILTALRAMETYWSNG